MVWDWAGKAVSPSQILCEHTNFLNCSIAPRNSPIPSLASLSVDNSQRRGPYNTHSPNLVPVWFLLVTNVSVVLAELTLNINDKNRPF